MMNWNMTADQLREAIDATNRSIEHHRHDVLEPLQRGEVVATSVISGNECALCNTYYGEHVRYGFDADDDDCVACPLYRMEKGCNEDGPYSPLWNRLRELRDHPDRIDRAIAASKLMIEALEETRAELQRALEEEEGR